MQLLKIPFESDNINNINGEMYGLLYPSCGSWQPTMRLNKHIDPDVADQVSYLPTLVLH